MEALVTRTGLKPEGGNSIKVFYMGSRDRLVLPSQGIHVEQRGKRAGGIQAGLLLLGVVIEVAVYLIAPQLWP